MSNARWYILFAVLIISVFILGIMYRYSRTHGMGRDTGTASILDWWGLPDRAPEIPQDEAMPVIQTSDRKLPPPPDFLFDSPPPDETAKSFKALSEVAKAIRTADESVNPASDTKGGLDSQ